MTQPEQSTENLSNGSTSLYQTFNRSIQAREKLQRTAIENILGREKETRLGYRKARDLPVEDEMEIDASKITTTTVHNHGTDWKSLLLAMLLGSGTALGIGVVAREWFLPNNNPMPPSQQITVPDTDTRLRLHLVDPD